MLDATTNAPIANAEVTLVNVTERGIAATTTTGRTGEFLFSGVEPGQYVLRPQRDGYLDDSDAFVNTTSRQFVLGPGQALTDRTLRLGAGGAIAGMVQDEERQGVANTLVSAFRFQYDDIRQAWMWISVQEAMTDERGEFRIGDLLPGRYIVQTTPLSDEPLSDSLARLRDSDDFGRLPRDLAEGNLHWDECLGSENLDGHAPIYFPNTSDPLQAARIDVDYGRESRCSDHRAARTRLQHSRRRCRSDAPEPAPDHRFPIVEKNQRCRGLEGAAIADDGTFEFRYVAPGTYDLNVILSTNEPAGTVPATVSEPSPASHPPRDTDLRPGQAGRPRGSHRRR